MLLTCSIEDLVSHISTYPNINALVISDLKTSQTVYCFYDRPEFKRIELDTIHQYFDDSLRTLLHVQQASFTPQELPILQSLGSWHCTVVERKRDGSITVYDATDTPVESHIGLG